MTPAKEQESPEVEPLGSETIYSTTYQAEPDVVIMNSCVPLRVPSFPFSLFHPCKGNRVHGHYASKKPRSERLSRICLFIIRYMHTTQAGRAIPAFASIAIAAGGLRASGIPDSRVHLALLVLAESKSHRLIKRAVHTGLPWLWNYPA